MADVIARTFGRPAGQFASGTEAVADLYIPVLGGIDRERDAAQGELVDIPLLDPLVRAPTGQAIGRSLLVTGLVVGGPEAQYRASGALLVATAAADGDPARLQRAVVAVTAPAATRTISRKDLVIGDRTAG